MQTIKNLEELNRGYSISGLSKRPPTMQKSIRGSLDSFDSNKSTSTAYGRDSIRAKSKENNYCDSTMEFDNKGLSSQNTSFRQGTTLNSTNNKLSSGINTFD